MVHACVLDLAALLQHSHESGRLVALRGTQRIRAKVGAQDGCMVDAACLCAGNTFTSTDVQSYVHMHRSVGVPVCA